jgi:hypothetical protein
MPVTSEKFSFFYNSTCLEILSFKNFQYHDQARKTEYSLNRIRLGALQRRAGASSDVSDNNATDTDKICMQLLLDIQVNIICILWPS